MSSPRRPTQLQLQLLETRETPAKFGEAWLDGRHLTLSFAKEGTPILGVASSLGSILNGLGVGNGRHEILRAFQSWASKANLNVGIVGDAGTPYDEAGAIQGDPRFGDIRIGARPLASDVVALTSPSGSWSSNSGDILVNSDKPFSVGGTAGTYDVFSVFLQEAGHAFGVGGSSDPASVMHQTYNGLRTGLTTGDVSSVQALYGSRQSDAHEGDAGNNTLATATTLTGQVEADVTTTADDDWYSFSAPAGVGTWVRLKASGVSLLAPKVEVYNAAGELLASGQSADPQDNDVNVQVGGLGTGGTYYVKVSGARVDDFGIGAYKLGVDTVGGLTTPDPNALVDTETGATGLSGAVTVAPVPQLIARPGDYLTRSALASATDADVFRVRAPSATGQPMHLVVSAAGVGAAGLNPRIQVYTASGLPLFAATASKSGNHLIVAVKNVTPGADYLVKITSATGTVANYDVACVFRSVLPSSHGADGTFSTAGQVTAATMYVYQSQVMHLSLWATGFAAADTTVRVSIYNAQNQVVYQMAVRANQLDSGTVFLKRGAYRVEIKALGTGSIPYLAVGLRMWGLTDPEGSGTGDTTDEPPPPGTLPLPTPPPGATDPVVIVPPPPPPPDTPPLTLSADLSFMWS